MTFVLAIDQGTTSTRAIVFRDDISHRGRRRSRNSRSIFPASGWVEHDPEDIWRIDARDLPRRAGARPGCSAGDIAAIGITNQRETTRGLGPRHRAGRSTAPSSGRTGAPPSSARGSRPRATSRWSPRKTGLLLDPYFSGTKIAWLLDNVAGARARAERGELLLRHRRQLPALAADRRPGARHRRHQCLAHAAVRHPQRRWDDELLALLRVPRALLPEVRTAPPISATTEPELFGGAIPIRGIAGDQQAATIGQACFAPGMMKSTYGTGCFALLNTGATPVASQQPAAHHHRLSARRRAHLCARGLDLRRRRGRAMAARRARHHQPRRRDRRARRRGRSRRRASIWCRPSSASARPIGMPRRAARCSA